MTVAFLTITPATAQDTPLPAQQDQDTLIRDDQLALIREQVVQLRELAPNEGVELTITTFEELYGYTATVYDGSWIADSQMHFYRAFDLIVGDPWKSIDEDVELSGLGGFYQPSYNEITLILERSLTSDEPLTPAESLVYAHEYTHAIQHSAFDLDEMLWDSFGNADREVALRALVEGDAVFTEEAFAAVAYDADPDSSGYLTFGLIGDFNMDVLPSIIAAESLLPYLDGLAFVKALYNVGGWELVNAAYDNPPTSTEQILHPERYIAGDVPQDVFVEPIDILLDNEEWVYVTQDTLGEFYLQHYLRTQLDDRAVIDATTGWGGDAYELYFNDLTDERAWVMRHAWDTQADASEFASIYNNFAEMRMAVRGEIIDDAMMCWQGNLEVLCFYYDARRGADTTVMAYAPTLRLARQIINLQVNGL